MEVLQYTNNTEVKNSEGLTALHIAIANGHAAAVDRLLQRGACGTSPNKDGLLPLHCACIAGNTDMARHLAHRFSQTINEAVNIDNEKLTPLHLASQYGHAECIDILLRYGADFDTKRIGRYTPLHIAAFNGHTKCVEMLLASGANQRAPDLAVILREYCSEGCLLNTLPNLNISCRNAKRFSSNATHND